MTSYQHPATGCLIYRIGRAPEPRAWPPANIEGRYSHPDGAVRVLYGASERRAAFLETLQSFRPALADLAALQHVSDDLVDFPVALSPGKIPDDYFRRLLATFRVDAAEPILDLNHAKRSMGRAYYAEDPDLHRVASVPLGVAYQWLAKYGVEAWNPDHIDRVKRLLNDPEWRYLKTAEVII